MEMMEMMSENSEWDGHERRSGRDRRSGQDRRINHGGDQRKASGEEHGPMGGSLTVLAVRGSDRRHRPDRRRRVLQGVQRTTSAFHAYLDTHPQVRAALEQRMKDQPAYRAWLRSLDSIVPAALECSSPESRDASMPTVLATFEIRP